MTNKTVQEVVREIEERDATEKREREAKIQKLVDASDAEKAAKLEAQRRSDEAAETERKNKFEAELERRARTRFFSKNRNASEELYQSVRDDLRRAILLEKNEDAGSSKRHSLYRDTW
jgi:hypothetical protein